MNSEEEDEQESQIMQLEEAVVEMKDAFVLAVQKLGVLESEERASREQQEKDKAHTEKQLAEALTLLLTLKNELGSTQQTVRSLQERTQSLEQSVRVLSEERDALTQELVLCGTLPQRHRGQAGGPGSSGAPSSDSGVALLLEKAHAAFSAPVNTLVHDYVATLGDSMSGDEGGQEAGYDSESSLSVAAAKSLSLSTSLGQQCGLELETEAKWRRLEVAKELLTAEQSYCRTLHTMHDAFAEPLRASGILSTTELNTLFPEEVWQLRTKHGVLLSGLRARISSWGPGTRVGDLLQNLLADVLGLYTSYANAFPDVLQTFHRLCRASPAFTRFLKSCLQRPACAGLDLGALLLTPVQHMPRYVLLMRQLLHVTPPGSEDHADISACLSRLKDFLARLNDSMEHSFQLVAAQIGPSPIPQSQNRSTSHHRVGRVEGRSRSRDAPETSRRRRPQSARPAPRAASDWALQAEHRRNSTDDESMLSSSEGGGYSATSEPSLVKANKSSKMSCAQSAQNVNQNTVTYVARTFWSNDPNKKKKSLRTSLKNILTFKKRCVPTPPSITAGPNDPEVHKSLQGLVQQLGRMPRYIELVVYYLRETAV